jgi:hypothetical protein
VDRIAIFFRVNRNAFNSVIAAGANNADRNFAAISD